MWIRKEKVLILKKNIKKLENSLIIDQRLQKKIDICNSYILGENMLELWKEFWMSKWWISNHIQSILKL